MTDPTGNGEPHPNRDAIAPILGRVPSGVFVLVAGDGEGRQTGMLSSWVQQASFDPPTVTVAVASKRYLNDWLAKNPQVVLNVVGEKQRRLLKHFGRGFEPDEPAFEGLETKPSANGLPVLSEALGHLAGHVTERVTVGDHVVYVVELDDGAGPADDARGPMVHVRKSGFGY